MTEILKTIAEEAHMEPEDVRSVLRSMVFLPEDVIAVGMNALIDEGKFFVISKDVTVPFYAVIHAILGDEDGTG